jgi:hypothetical protein
MVHKNHKHQRYRPRPEIASLQPQAPVEPCLGGIERSLPPTLQRRRRLRQRVCYFRDTEDSPMRLLKAGLVGWQVHALVFLVVSFTALWHMCMVLAAVATRPTPQQVGRTSLQSPTTDTKHAEVLGANGPSKDCGRTTADVSAPPLSSPLSLILI